MTVTTRTRQCNATPRALVMALELGARQWQVAMTTGDGQRLQRRTLAAAEWRQLPAEIAVAKGRLGVAADAPVWSCYEAGPDGFWVHRYLTTLGVQNLVVDSSSIEVPRRARRAKTDRLDAQKLMRLLLRWLSGDRDALRAVRVPPVPDEHRRQWARELLALRRDRTRVTNRIGSLLATQGVRLKVRKDFPTRLAHLCDWQGQPLAGALQARLAREWEKVALLTAQIDAVRHARRAVLPQGSEAAIARVRQLLALRGVGENGAWLLGLELFAPWRQLRNRRQVGGLTGLVGTPYRSGATDHDQGISHAGNAAVRAIAIELAWCWLQYQPRSALTRWYRARFARGGRAAQKIGIVALARRLVIALWRYVEFGVLPEGALLKPGVSGAGPQGGGR
jgi:transposase